jgi:DNA-binding response OmpR family regulator
MLKRSLLIVDSDAYYAGIYANRFEKAGWKVRVEDGIEGAGKYLSREVPDVLIIELDPVDEVLLFLRELRSGDDTKDMMQVTLVELGDRELAREALEVGVDSYLLKGHFVPAEAVKKIERLLEER